MKVLIVEDEALIAKSLQRLLKEIAPDAEVLAVTDTVRGTVKWLKANSAPQSDLHGYTARRRGEL
jgi:DNA-binding LytR/AlgR family response regulator